MTWFLSKALWRPSKCGVSQINCFCSTNSISISNTNIEVQKFDITNLHINFKHEYRSREIWYNPPWIYFKHKTEFIEIWYHQPHINFEHKNRNAKTRRCWRFYSIPHRAIKTPKRHLIESSGNGVLMIISGEECQGVF